jgi:hypothetical protein
MTTHTIHVVVTHTHVTGPIHLAQAGTLTKTAPVVAAGTNGQVTISGTGPVGETYSFEITMGGNAVPGGTGSGTIPGTPPGNGTVSQSVTLPPGNYTVTITNTASGATATADFTVSAP